MFGVFGVFVVFGVFGVFGVDTVYVYFSYILFSVRVKKHPASRPAGFEIKRLGANLKADA